MAAILDIKELKCGNRCLVKSRRVVSILSTSSRSDACSGSTLAAQLGHCHFSGNRSNERLARVLSLPTGESNVESHDMHMYLVEFMSLLPLSPAFRGQTERIC